MTKIWVESDELWPSRAKSRPIIILEQKSLHDRIGEILATIGSWMGYNTYVRHKITPDHNQELDVAWLKEKNPAVAIEVQIGGSIPSAIANLTQAKKFNYRKVIIVIKESQLRELNDRIKFDEIRYWLDAWSIKSVYEMHQSGESFFRLYENIEESRFRDRKTLDLI